LYDPTGQWVINVTPESQGTPFTITLSFLQGRVYLNDIDVGRAIVSQASITFEINRTLGSGTAVDENYYGFFDDENNVSGSMSRYYEPATAERYTFTATR
ncbi:MAG: hypothetical protein GY950_05930, partial [bacterium]|nr:hypothetical protein [bacterium]